MKKLIGLLIRYVPRKYLQMLSPLGLKALGFFYKGDAVQCPICEKKYKQFLPYGRGDSARANALCPSCLSLERHRLIWLYLKEKTPFFTDSLKVLHIAPEACFITRFQKMKNLDYVTADIESPLAQVKMDIHDIPFEEKTFEVVFCNHVLEHVADDIRAASEMHRVLKPGGWAILQVPFFKEEMEVTYEDANITTPTERFKAFGQEDHVRMYGRDYAKRLAKGGFEVKEDDFARHLPPELIQKHALPANEVIYFAYKNN